MLFDRRAFLHRLTGKLESRSFVAKRLGGESALVPLVGVIREPGEVAKIAFPARFIMKSNHGSGMLYLHDTETPPDLEHLQQLCREWLALDYGKYYREWVYNGVERAVLVEELLTDAFGGMPTDYKFFCYDGVPRFIKTDSNHLADHTSDIFDLDWNLIPGSSDTPNSAVPPPRPPHLAEMLGMAAMLSRGMDFVRVDLYDTTAGVKFGELTNTPAAAAYVFKPRSLDYQFGKHWKVSRKGELPDAWPVSEKEHQPTGNAHERMNDSPYFTAGGA